VEAPGGFTTEDARSGPMRSVPMMCREVGAMPSSASRGLTKACTVSPSTVNPFAPACWRICFKIGM